MRIVKDNPEQLILEDKPVVLATILAISILLFLGLGFLAFSAEPWVTLGAVLGAALMAICFVAFVRRVFVQFDRAAGGVVIRSASVFGQTELQLPLTDIAEAVVETTTSLDDHDSPTTRTLMHRPALRLRDRRRNQPLIEVYSGGKGAAKVVAAINRWLMVAPQP